jgi:hypothetical protein
MDCQRSPAVHSHRAMLIDRATQVVSALLLLIIVALQWASGAYHREFGSHPDEAAHYVTARMIADYVANPQTSPVEFARSY